MTSLSSTRASASTTDGIIAQVSGDLAHPALKPLDPALDTLPKHFVTLAKRYGQDHIAMRKKRLGVWNEYTWSASHDHVRNFCLGLVSLGLQRGEKVSIIGDNDPEYYWAQLAVQAAGGISIGIFTDANPQELGYVLTDSDSVFVIAQDQEQCDKLLELRESLPNVRAVVYWDERGLWSYHNPWLISFDAMQAKGRDYEAAHPGAFEALVEAGNGDDIAIFSYTSGTTSLPKGAMLTHRNLIYGMRHVLSIAPVTDADNYVSFSPLAWITEQLLGVAAHVCQGQIVNFPEKSETVHNDIREIAPSSLLFPSRLWESLISLVQVRMNDASWLNRAFYRLFMPVGYKVVDFQDAGKTVPLLWQGLYRLGDLAIFGPLRDKLGMVHMREAYTSGASLSPDALRWFRAIGVTLKNLYGSTECQAHTLHYTGEVRFDTVGKPPPGVEIRISAQNEIWIRSRSVFQGYYKAKEATAKALDNEGFFHSGDAGFIREDGHLVYLDRVKDLIELANGERFSPQYLEIRLKFSPYIQDVMALGSNQTNFVAALIIIQFDNVARWAEKRRVSFTTYVDLTQKPEVYELIQADIARVNSVLPPSQRIARFVILHKAFDADEAELTRTRKLRRGFLADRYKDIIEAIYEGKDAVEVRAEVKYRDGRAGVVETTVRIADVK
ncbi:MAG: AMP-binding protein [Anaerolineae bacterium]|nr:AMP-binding protein [Anaerolineae bacterium]